LSKYEQTSLRRLRLKVFLTGRVGFETDGAVIDEARFPGRQGRLLFAYLVAEQGRPVPRHELADAIWGEAPPATWEKVLTVVVSKLRSLLAEHGVADPGVLTGAFGCYRLELPEGSWVDVIAAADAAQEAEQALQSGDLQRAQGAASLAASLTRQQFLPGEDGAWVEEKRRELTAVRGHALAALAEVCLRSGNGAEAAKWAEQTIALAPFRESGYRRLMEAHAAAGNRAEALSVYEQCRRLLADELGAYPSPETESIYRELLELPAAPRAGAPRVAASPPLPQSQMTTRRMGRRVLLVIGGLVLAAIAAVAAVRLGEGRGAALATLRAIESARCSALHYEGAGSPQLLIAVDLPIQPGALETTAPMVDAITLQLQRRRYTAGRHRVGLQVCDDATPRGVLFDERVCIANAREYVDNRSVIGVIGPLTSGCAARQIPILNRASRGPVAIVSPSATVVALTRPVSSPASTKPGALYPTGERNFARVIAADDVQPAASAVVARRLGVESVYALDAGHEHSVSFVDGFVRAARRLGVSVVGRGSWVPGERGDAAVAAAIARTGADGVFLGIESFPASVRLLTKLRARLGSKVQFMAPEVFDPKTAVLAGTAAEGMTISQPGPSNDDLTATGKQFAASFAETFGVEPTRYALAAAQATDVMLDAIAHSDGSRASVTRNLFKTRVSNGILGSFWITPTGDTTLNTVAVYRIVGGKVKTFETVRVPDALIAPD
jgi:DNA-binding SARP family transcriptional activator/ABC-type branched-subunit amino acid transport system substrate-binding protein